MSEDVSNVDSAVFPISREETILVVDADARERARMVEGLLLCGFRVASACGAQDAFYTATAVRPDLVLIAMALPSSSGVELARTMKHDPRLREIPIMTYGDGALAGAIDGAASRVLVRPIRSGELVAVLRARIASPRSIRKACPTEVPHTPPASRVATRER